MVTIMSNGKPHTFTSESVLMQLPTPLLCMRRTPRSPPSQAPAKMPIPSSSVVRTVGSIPSVAWHNSISCAWPASGTYATWRTSNWRSFSNIRFGQFCACPAGLVEHARLGQALHGHDIRVVCLRSVLRTAAHCYSIDQNRTSSAYPMLTADVNSEGLKVMTQEIAEEHARLSLARSALPIQCYFERKALAGCTMQDCHSRRFLCSRAMSSAAFTARSTSTFVSAVR